MSVLRTRMQWFGDGLVLWRILVVSLMLGGVLAAAAPMSEAQVAPGVRYWFMEPRVVDFEDPAPVRFVVEVSGQPERAELALVNGSTVALEAKGDGRFEAILDPSQVLSSYEDGYLHHLLGRIHLFQYASDPAPTWNSGANVNVLPGDPRIPIRFLAPDAQAAPHVLNLRFDELYLGGPVPVEVVRRFYELMGDDYDFLAVIEQHESNHNRFFISVMNNVSGTGRPASDRTSTYGSAGRLQGILHFPISWYYDAGETAMSHELGHQWMEYLEYADPATGQGAHWPYSDLAYGVMGRNGFGGQGISFPYRLEPMENGDYQLVGTSQAQTFNDLELYLMGLADASEVGPHILMENQSSEIQEDAIRQGFLKGPGIELHINDVIDLNGPRDPPFGEAPTTFRAATIVLSQGRLLSAQELAFFDVVAQRGEAESELPYRSGLAQGMVKPFHLATQERGRLNMSLSLDPPLSDLLPPLPPLPANSAPTASFTYACTDLACSFTDNSTDADGSITSWDWDFGDGGTSTAQNPTHTYAAGGTYTVTLTVTDDAGAADSTSQEVTVSDPPPPNTPPTATFTHACQDLSCSFDGSGSTDPDGSVASYAWEFGDGATATGATASHDYTDAGSYTVTLTVTDDDGASDSTSQEVTVSDPPPPNTPPTATFKHACQDLACSFDGTGSSDADGSIVGYAWDFGDGATATGVTASHDYTDAGSYTVTLTVTDDDGATNSTSQEVTVSDPPPPNTPPTATFTFACTDLSCGFDGSGSSDSDGSIAAYGWDFGDGTTGTGATTNHGYDAAGTYTVTLTVTDDDGATGSASQQVTVSDPPPPPNMHLEAYGYKERGVQRADLSWTGATGAMVDVYRDDAVVVTTANDGAHTDNIDQRGKGSYVYRVCEAGTTTCSNEAVVAVGNAKSAGSAQGPMTVSWDDGASATSHPAGAELSWRVPIAAFVAVTGLVAALALAVGARTRRA